MMVRWPANWWRLLSWKINLLLSGWKLAPMPTTRNGFVSSCEHCVWGVCACEMLPTFEKLLDDFIQEETRLEIISGRVEEIQNLALIGKVRRGGKKEYVDRVSRARRNNHPIWTHRRETWVTWSVSSAAKWSAIHPSGLRERKPRNNRSGL